MATDTVIKKVVREIVREELKPVAQKLEINLSAKMDQVAKLLLDQMAFMRNDILNLKDELVGEIKTNREEQSALNTRSRKIDEIEDEIEILKQIHPQNQHQFA